MFDVHFLFQSAPDHVIGRNEHLIERDTIVFRFQSAPDHVIGRNVLSAINRTYTQRFNPLPIM